jgi:hypothetical protein
MLISDQSNNIKRLTGMEREKKACSHVKHKNSPEILQLHM